MSLVCQNAVLCGNGLSSTVIPFIKQYCASKKLRKSALEKHYGGNGKNNGNKDFLFFPAIFSATFNLVSFRLFTCTTREIT